MTKSRQCTWIVPSKVPCEIEVSENAMLRSLCDSAQAWLDAAANLAPEHLKQALIKNANEFRRVYAKITDHENTN